MKKKIALIFGGRSAEHEVSINSAHNIFKAMDLNLYEPLLVGVSKEGSWYYFSSSEVFTKYKLMLLFLLFMELWAKMALFKVFLK